MNEIRCPRTWRGTVDCPWPCYVAPSIGQKIVHIVRSLDREEKQTFQRLPSTRTLKQVQLSSVHHEREVDFWIYSECKSHTAVPSFPLQRQVSRKNKALLHAQVLMHFFSSLNLRERNKKPSVTTPFFSPVGGFCIGQVKSSLVEVLVQVEKECPRLDISRSSRDFT